MITNTLLSRALKICQKWKCLKANCYFQKIRVIWVLFFSKTAVGLDTGIFARRKLLRPPQGVRQIRLEMIFQIPKEQFKMKENFVDYRLPQKCKQWMALAMICYFMEIDLMLIQFYRKTTCGRKGDMAVRKRDGINEFRLIWWVLESTQVFVQLQQQAQDRIGSMR